MSKLQLELYRYDLHDDFDNSHCCPLDSKIESGMLACFCSLALGGTMYHIIYCTQVGVYAIPA